MSGTIGVFAACLAVTWLIRSVSLQKQELQHFKDELESLFNEQRKQTHINALTALLTSNQQAIANDRTLLNTINNGSEGESFKKNKGTTALLLYTTRIEGRIQCNIDAVDFYESQLEGYLPKV